MELNSDLYNKSFQEFRAENTDLDLQIQEEFESIYRRCKERLDNMYMVEEPILFEKMNEGYDNFYYLLDKAFFYPYNCKIEAYEIYFKMPYNDFMKGGIHLNLRVFRDYSEKIIEDIFYRKIRGLKEIDLEKLYQDLEDYLFKYAIYQTGNAYATFFSYVYQLQLYPEEPLLGFGHTFLKELSESQIKNHSTYVETQDKLKKLVSSIGKGFPPFSNFALAINKLYNSLVTLQAVNITREEFLQILANNYSGTKSDKIVIDLSNKGLTRVQIGLLFLVLRENFCQDHDSKIFKEWLIKNFIINKKDGTQMNLDKGQTAADLISQNYFLNDPDSKFKMIRDLLT